jgi:hypothetical protein
MRGLSLTAPLLSRMPLRSECREASGLRLIGGRVKAPKQAAGGRRFRILGSDPKGYSPADREFSKSRILKRSEDGKSAPTEALACPCDETRAIELQLTRACADQTHGGIAKCPSRQASERFGQLQVTRQRISMLCLSGASVAMSGRSKAA